MNRFSIAEDFSRCPAGRKKTDGPHSGEALREILVEKLKDGPLTVDLSGTLGFGSSFLEEAFGGLGGENFEFVGDAGHSLVTEIRDYLPSRAELIRDRNELLDALAPLALALACLKTKGRFSFLTGATEDCGDCAVCKARKVMSPLVKWIRKGWKRSRA